MIRGPRPFHKPTKTCKWFNTCSSRYYCKHQKECCIQYSNTDKTYIKNEECFLQYSNTDKWYIKHGSRCFIQFSNTRRNTLNTRERVYPTFNPDDWYIKQFPVSKLALKYSNPLLFLWVSVKQVLPVANTHLSFPAHVQLGWECCRHHYSAWTPQCRQDEIQQHRIHQLWHEQGIKSNKHGQGFPRKILRSTQKGTAVSSEEIKRGYPLLRLKIDQNQISHNNIKLYSTLYNQQKKLWEFINLQGNVLFTYQILFTNSRRMEDSLENLSLRG